MAQRSSQHWQEIYSNKDNSVIGPSGMYLAEWVVRLQTILQKAFCLFGEYIQVNSR